MRHHRAAARYLAKAEGDKHCPLCSSDLSETELLRPLITKLQRNIDKAKKGSESNKTAADGSAAPCP